MPTDVVFPAKATENLQVHYDAAHKWYYLEDQEPSELLVFRQADSHPVGRVGTFDRSHLDCLHVAHKSARCTPLVVPQSISGRR